MVEGVNNTNVILAWEFIVESGENVQHVTLGRQKPTEITQTIIASRHDNTAFAIANNEFANKYIALLPARLQLLHVNNTEEYEYSITVILVRKNVLVQFFDIVTIVVFGKYQKILFADSCADCAHYLCLRP